MAHTTLNLELAKKILGTVICIIAIAEMPVMAVSFFSGDRGIACAFAVSAAVFLAVGSFARVKAQPKTSTLKMKEGIIIVALSWLVASVEGAVPYLLSGYTTSFASAFFESTAGFTTTGATVFDIVNMPKSIILWKAICNWLGGMGILVFLVTLLPSLGVSGQKIFKAESPGLQVDKIAGRIADSAKILYLMYISFTIAEFLLLLSGGNMSALEAAINTLGSISTGGIFSHSQGLAYYDSLYVNIVISVFTILATINFTLYYHILQGDIRLFFKNTELRAYIGIIVAASLLVGANLYFSSTYDSAGEALMYGFFQATSFSSTSGYAIADYSTWPLFSRLVLLVLMLIGGCAASTSSSVKVIRIVIMFKLLKRSIYKRIHPRAVVAVKLEGNPVHEDLLSQTTSFVFAFFATLLAGTLLLSFQNLDMETTFSAALAMLSNTGICFGELGPSGYFGMFSAPLQIVLSLLMTLGRLELFTVLLLFIPSFWNPDRAKSV